jgi:glycosyltransferase involved in cell wall biosynthesis
MRILQLVSCRGWSSDAYWAASITAALGRAGHEATLACKRGTDDRVIQPAREAGVHRIETFHFDGGVSPARDADDLRRLISWLGRVDVVHVHRGKEHWLAALANRLSRSARPLVRTRHIVQPIRPHALNRWLYRKATDAVVTVTEAIRRQYVAAELAPPQRVLALQGGVDLGRFHPFVDPASARRAFEVPAGEPLVGLVSGFRVMKGHRTAVDAARRLAAAGRRFRLVFIGRGALESDIRRAITDAGLAECITVAGFVPDLPASMAALDVAVYAAVESDGMSRVLFEYLAAGRPVVASRVGVVPEILEDGRSGLLVAAGDAEGLARAIGRLLDDPSLRAEVGAAGARLVRSRFSAERIARELVEVYARLADRARRSS